MKKRFIYISILCFFFVFKPLFSQSIDETHNTSIVQTGVVQLLELGDSSTFELKNYNTETFGQVLLWRALENGQSVSSEQTGGDSFSVTWWTEGMHTIMMAYSYSELDPETNQIITAYDEIYTEVMIVPSQPEAPELDTSICPQLSLTIQQEYLDYLIENEIELYYQTTPEGTSKQVSAISNNPYVLNSYTTYYLRAYFNVGNFEY